MTKISTTSFQVGRDDLRTTRFAESEVEAGPGQILLEVDRFALTANNITYAVFGDAMRYWDFFPAPEGWGHVPVWGFADVVESHVDGIEVGERIYGYVPMTTHLVVEPTRVDHRSFMDGAEHRRPLPGAYQHYTRCASDDLYEAAREDNHAIFYPLFFTSFMCEDLLSDNDLFSADQVVIASASSKTALGIAFLMSQKERAKVVALTSAGNADFCATTKYYDNVVTYDALTDLDPTTKTVFVDVAGSGTLLHDVHHHFRDSLVYSCIVGATHWEERSTQHDLPGAQPEFFFAPTQGAKRRREWGSDGVDQKVAEAWRAFLPSVDPWLEVRRGGRADVERVYREVLEGQQLPHVGHTLTLR
ncbi:MAG: DUF2855 family protein [Actinomycetota bacterium]